MHDWVEKAIQWKLRKRLNVYYITKWYTRKPESVLENDTYKVLWDFEIQTDHLIEDRLSDD